MAQLPDIETQTKKRHIEDVLSERIDLIGSPKNSVASGSVVFGGTQPKDGSVAGSDTADTVNPSEFKIKVEDDHLSKKRRLDTFEDAAPGAESSATVNLKTEAVEVGTIVEEDSSPNQSLNLITEGDQEQAAGGSSKRKFPESYESSPEGSQLIAKDVRTVQKRRLDNSQLESNADSMPPTLSTSTADFDSATAATQEEIDAGSIEPPAKKQRLGSTEFMSSTIDDHTSKPAEDKELSAQLKASSKQSPLVSLPFELLAEILILTGSSQHVLAVARTCKALCHLLLGPEAQFIWRVARSGSGCTFELELEVPPPSILIPPGIVGGGVLGALQGLAMAPATVVAPNVNDVPAPTKKTVKLPNLPPQFFSEAAYAAFVFDSGKCDNCGNETSVMYNSFGLRVRLCKKASCKKPHNLNLPQLPGSSVLLSILPTDETISFLHHPLGAQTIWPSPMHHRVHKAAFDAAKAEHSLRHKEVKYQNKFKVLQARKKEWMDFCAGLYKWKDARQEHYYRTKKANENLGKQLASKHGWDYDLIINHTKYGVYKRQKTLLIENVAEADVNAMKDDIEAELLAYTEKAERRKTEISLMHNRKDVAELYERLRSGSVHTYLPSLATFRQLPVISMLQTAERDKKSTSAVKVFEKNPTMNELLNNQLKKWTDKAKMDFGVILGFPKNWKHASKNVLHPVERVTARFVCTRCQRVDTKYRADGCLDFIGVCKHECGVGNAKKGRIRKGGNKAIWDSENFAKDDKAINVLKKALPLLNYAEDKDGGNHLTKVGMAVMCKSCDPPMVLDTRTIVGHSHRHDNMELSLPLLDDVCSHLGGYPYEHGVVVKLLAPAGVFPAAKAEIDAKNFGCRHCLRTAQVNEAASADYNGTGVTMVAEASKTTTPIELASVVHRMHDTGIQGPPTRPPLLFNFNGMRSHLKAKHQIEDVRDEDILCRREVNLTLDE